MDVSHITPEELSEAVGSRVQSCSMTPLREVNGARGYMADVYRLEFVTDRESRSLIMKVASSDDSRREIAERFGSYRNEQRFYGDLNCDLPFRVPRCFYNATDRFLLLLEDLGDEGIVDPLKGASKRQARDAIQTLARIHAHFHLNPPAMVQNIDTGLAAASIDMQSFVLDALQSVNWPDQPAIKLARDYASNSRDFIQLFQRQDQVFTHLDFRLDNLRFQRDVIVLDWGESTHAPAGFDLASFLTSSITVEHRRAWEESLLADYCETRQGMEPGFDASSVFDSYRLALLPALYLPGLVLSQETAAEGQTLLTRALTAIEDHQSFLQASVEHLA